MIRRCLVVSCFLLSVALHAATTISGELKKWHRVTLTFDGPALSEGGTPNPFRDYRLNVTFSKGTRSIVVPGFYAADGNAGESSATSGAKWRCHFAPDEAGDWSYVVSFRTGTDVAISTDPNAGTATSFNGASGVITIAATDKSGRDLRGKGALRYVGEHYLRFAETGEYYIKGGADSPENFLAYYEFDNTPKGKNILHQYVPHAGDWQSGDPVWQGSKGKNIIGALNYLSSKGMNAVYFLTMNVTGDGDDVFPWTTKTERYRFDCSKLDQWEVVFSHMTRKGILLHVITQETENDQLLDGGNLDVQRKLYYRELIARFSHHPALVWNLGEENTNTDQQRKDFAKFIKDTDPYDHAIVIHTYPGQQSSVYTPLLGYAYLDGVSLQTTDTHGQTKTWIDNSAANGRKWIACLDEVATANEGVVPDANDPNHDGIRKTHLWGNLMAGGAGVEWYFGYSYPHSDLTCEDWRSRNNMWDQTRVALEFFQTHLPFTQMRHNDGLTSATNDYCFAKPGEVYAVYLPNGGTTSLNLGTVAASYSVKWFNPKSGGALQNGSVTSVSGPGTVALGNPPSNSTADWVILVKRSGTVTTYPLTVNSGSGSGNYAAGAAVNIVASAPASGQMFDRWTGDTSGIADVLNPNTTLTMPAAATTVTATYKTATAQAVSSFTLINADTDVAVPGYDPLNNGATLNLATLPTRNLSVRANTNPATVGSVRFGLDGNANYKIESAAPYSLTGDTNGNYNPWTPAVGSHTLSGTPYTGASASGTAGTTLTITFNVIDDANAGLPAAPSNLSASAASSSSINLVWSDNATNETGFKLERKTGTGAFTQIALLSANALSFSDSGLSASTTYVYRLRATNASGDSPYSNEASATTQSAPAPTNAVTSFTLINADTNQPIAGYDPLNNGATLNLATLPTRNLNIRANTNPTTVGSVRFALDANSNYRTESAAPYALAGDSNGDYYAWTPATGTHTLKATPYTGSSAGGTAGTALSISFTVSDQAALAAKSETVEEDSGVAAIQQTLSLKKFSGKLASGAGSSAVLQAELQLAGKNDFSGAFVTLNLGGASVSFVLDEKGSARTAENSLQVKLTRSGLFRVKATLRKINFESAWIDEGLSVPDASGELQVLISIDDYVFSMMNNLIIKRGRFGLK
ncbi:MAG TPA: DUF5060 domain-containing protein [Planctomycetota bacterium]|nr:DUF5060 domain-containing protein [Planctomycetota bacterium]